MSGCLRSCAPSLDPQLVPFRHRLCHMSPPIVLFPSALIDIPPVKIPTPTLSPTPKQSQHQNRLVSTKCVCLCMPPMSLTLYCSPSWPLTIPLSTLFPPRLLAFVASHFPFAALCFLPCILSCAPFHCLHPPVLCLFRRLTFHIDVVRWSLMYLKTQVRPVLNVQFPIFISLSLLQCAFKTPSSFKLLCQFSAAEQIHICLVHEDPPWFAYLISSHSILVLP